MNRLMKFVTAILMSFALFACSGDPTFDASSKEAMESSAKIMSEGLSEEKGKDFKKSLAKLAMQIGFEAAKNGALSDKDVMKAVADKLDGLTVDEIIALAKE